jgi:hypothetical protein
VRLRGKVASRTILTRTPSRMAVCEIILTEPGVTWAVTDVCDRLRSRQVSLAKTIPSAETVRATLYVLAAEGILQEMRSGNTLRFRLDGPGAVRLRATMERWSGEQVRGPNQVRQATMVTQIGRRMWLSTSADHRCEEMPDASASGCRWCEEHALMVVAQGDGRAAGVMSMMGALVFGTAGVVCDAVAFVLRGPVRTLVLDASGVVTVDAPALQTLGGLQRSASIERRSLLVNHKRPTSLIGQRFRDAGVLGRITPP